MTWQGPYVAGFVPGPVTRFAHALLVAVRDVGDEGEGAALEVPQVCKWDGAYAVHRTRKGGVTLGGAGPRDGAVVAASVAGAGGGNTLAGAALTSNSRSEFGGSRVWSWAGYEWSWFPAPQ